jgi:hypothetical protein
MAARSSISSSISLAAAVAPRSCRCVRLRPSSCEAELPAADDDEEAEAGATIAFAWPRRSANGARTTTAVAAAGLDTAADTTLPLTVITLRRG